MPRTRTVTTIAALAGLVFCAVASPVGAQATRPEADPFGNAVFAPDLIMMHAREIQLTAEQRSAITHVIQELQGRAVALQLQMVEEMRTATELLEQDRVDEEPAVAALQRVLALEQEVKTAQVRMLIRIKNTLTPRQQQLLRELRGQPDAGRAR